MSDLAINRDTVRRRLDLIRVVAIADGVLLIALLIAAVTDSEGIVNVLGPIHGIGYLILLFLCIRGAAEQLWGWWFPAIVVVTLGPPGSLIGDLRIRRRLT
jgi:integral membrane protein